MSIILMLKLHLRCVYLQVEPRFKVQHPQTPTQLKTLKNLHNVYGFEYLDHILILFPGYQCKVQASRCTKDTNLEFLVQHSVTSVKRLKLDSVQNGVNDIPYLSNAAQPQPSNRFPSTLPQNVILMWQAAPWTQVFEVRTPDGAYSSVQAKHT